MKRSGSAPRLAAWTLGLTLMFCTAGCQLQTPEGLWPNRLSSSPPSQWEPDVEFPEAEGK